MRRLALTAALAAFSCAEAVTPAPDLAPATHALETYFVDVGDARIRVAEAGAKTDAVVLLLHGGRFSSANWIELGTLEVLAAEGWRAVAVDLPGFGESSATEVGRADFLAALITTLGAERPVIVSPSFSGSFSLPFVTRSPARVAAFVPVGVAGSEAYLSSLAELELPTLVMWGEDDDSTPLETGRRLAETIPNAELAVFDGASHPCYLDCPDEFHGRLSAFLASL